MSLPRLHCIPKNDGMATNVGKGYTAQRAKAAASCVLLLTVLLLGCANSTTDACTLSNGQHDDLLTCMIR